jgi:hypothetical protein
MPDWLTAFLLGIFAIHLFIFVRLALKRRQLYYVAVSTTFALLVLAFGLRLSFPDLRAGGIQLHWIARWLAWASAAVSISWLLIRKLQRPRQPTEATEFSDT